MSRRLPWLEREGRLSYPGGAGVRDGRAPLWDDLQRRQEPCQRDGPGEEDEDGPVSVVSEGAWASAQFRATRSSL